MPNALLLWLPLATLYCIVAAVAVFWRSKNDFYASGSQKGLFAFTLLPSIPLGLAGWWTFTSVLMSSVQMLGSVRGTIIQSVPNLPFKTNDRRSRRYILHAERLPLSFPGLHCSGRAFHHRTCSQSGRVSLSTKEPVNLSESLAATLGTTEA